MKSNVFENIILVLDFFWIVPFFLLSVLFLAGIFFITKKRSCSYSFPYQKQYTLFSPAERSFLGVLDQVINDDHRIFGKVRLADVIKTKSGISNRLKQEAFNRISRKHVDFVVCRKDTLEIELLIELDDKSHEAPSRKIRDEFFNQAIEVAGIPLLRIPVQNSYSLMNLAEKIEAIMGKFK